MSTSTSELKTKLNSYSETENDITINISQTTFHNIPNVKDVDILRINATKNLNVPNMQEPNFLITAHWAKILKKLAA
ncbi:hypothetical protein V1477_003388 [Vespula maculifrons]|uniref:Uncharacterized protein n=1 Tax=Vespula maculifrons TaxID=7453 RepID=A0ABD2CUH8_VESMC